MSTTRTSIDAASASPRSISRSSVTMPSAAIDEPARDMAASSRGAYAHLTAGRSDVSHRGATEDPMRHLIVFALLCAACVTLSPTASSSSQLGELTRRRDEAIARLQEYRKNGVFPTDAGGMPLSVFRDAHGVRCPMAQLIHDSGRDDLVNAVVAKDN